MKRNWMILLAVCLLLTAFLAACTDKTAESREPGALLPTIQPDASGPAPEPSGSKTEAPETLPAETQNEAAETAEPTTEPALETEEDVSEEYVFEAGENAGVGGN